VRPSSARLLLSTLLAAGLAGTGHAGNPRVIDMQLRAEIREPGVGQLTAVWKDLLSDQLPMEKFEQIWGCVGRVGLGLELTWTKNADDSITVTGPIKFFEGRGCRRSERARQQVDVRIPADGEATVAVDIRAPGNDTAIGELVLRNGRPTCTGRHIRFRSTMHIVDDETIGDSDVGDFVSKQMSVFLEPGEIPAFVMRRCVDSEVVGDLRVVIAEITPDHARADVTLTLFEGSGCDTDDNDDRERRTVLIPDGPPQTVTIHAEDDSNVVDVVATLENGGQQCWAEVIRAPILLNPLWVLTPPAACTPNLRGCYVRADGRAGWLRVSGESCTGAGSSRRCSIEGSGSGLVCTGGSWTFRDAVVDRDCRGARIALQCLGKVAAILRADATGTTLRREDRQDTTALVPGTSCP